MSEFSGRFVLRIPPDLHRRLRELAAREGRSLNEVCRRLLAAAIGPASPGAAQRSPAAPGGLPVDVPPELMAAIRGAWPEVLVGVVLFGSAARGEATAASDVDLLIVLDQGVEISRALYREWDRGVAGATRRAGREFTPQFVVLPRSPEAAGGIWLEVARDGIVLDDPKGRAARFLAALRDYAMSGAVVRKVAHGQPYWVREGPAK